MSTEQQPEVKGTCFVVMGFGKKTDFETGRTLDLNLTYNYIIKPAVTAAGLKCIRADEIVHTGPIDVPMYEQLLNADVVVADISTSNKNAFYELGVRHALKPYTTVIICEDGIKSFPFDINHVAVRQYRHMGEGIDFGEVERFRKVLTDTIVEVYNREERSTDSPVYTFIKGLTQPKLEDAMKAVAKAAAESAPGADDAAAGAGEGDDAKKLYSELWRDVDAAQKAGKFMKAKALLEVIRERMKPEDPKDPDEPRKPEDPYIIQRLALVTYKAKYDTAEEQVEALNEARSLLEGLNPGTSNDTETLGLWGAVHKRLWDKTGDAKALDEAVRGYERGFYLRNDYYNGINLAFILNVRATNAKSHAEAVADFVQAGRVRREVLDICGEVMKDGGPPSDEQKYWVLATAAEALLGVGDEEGATRKFEEACAFIPNPQENKWMRESTEEQMNKLRALLADSPLKYVKADGE